MRYQYCPRCGEKLKDREIGDEGLVPYCGTCGRPWFDTFSTCVIVLVVDENNEAALLRQDYISSRYHNLVSGYMKPGETAEECSVREVEEEIGVRLERLEFAGTYWFGRKDMLMVGFFGYGKKTALTLSEEVESAVWVPVEEALSMVHPRGSVSYALVEKYLKEK